MPQINRIRVNNVKYNFGTQYYDDFMMRFNCSNALYDLANGGGKSLLMLLLMQNVIPNCTLDDKQPIEKLFRAGSGNTVIHSLVEWKLDPCYQKENYKFMTTGFCARRAGGKGSDEEADAEADVAYKASANAGRESVSSAVEYFNYCIFYREFGDNDIKNLPLESHGERITYNGLKAYLRDLEKNDLGVSVKIFETKGEYLNFIAGYGLFESHWEIVRGINKTEGHVRTYFENSYKTSRKVVEDLLIEEIIQKSYNNTLGVENDEGTMASTLMDIKDKLLELSKKHAQISGYDSQIASLNEFSDYVRGFKTLYDEKDRLLDRLYRLMVACRQALLDNQSHKADTELRLEELNRDRQLEYKCAAIGEIAVQKASLADMKQLTDVAAAEVERIDRQIEEKRKRLTQLESAQDYRDYLEYSLAVKQVTQVIDNRNLGNEEIIGKMRKIASEMKRVTDEKRAHLTEEQAKEKASLSKLEEKLASADSGCSDAMEAQAGARAQIEYVENDLKNMESELTSAMEDAGVLIAENASDVLSETNGKLALAKDNIDTLESNISDIHKKKASMENRREVLALNNRLLNDQLAEAKKRTENMQSDKSRLEKLLSIYSASSRDDLLGTLYGIYDKMGRQIAELDRELAEIDAFIQNAQNGTYECHSRDRDRLAKYLSDTYGDDVVEGHEWFRNLNAGQKRDVFKRLPFVEYAFVIKNDFDRIKEDAALMNFQRGAVVYPIVSENVLYDTKLEVNTELVAFAMKDMNFLRDDAALEVETETAREERSDLSRELEKLTDRRNVVWDDYSYVYQQALWEESATVIDKEEIKRQIEENEGELKRIEADIQDTDRAGEAADARLSELVAMASQLKDRAAALKCVAELSEKLREKRTLKDKLNSELIEAQDKLSQSRTIQESVRKSCNDAKNRCEALEREISKLDANWNELYMPYYVEGSEENTASEGRSVLDMEGEFLGLKELLDKENSDLSDKETLLRTYRNSMEKCVRAIEYRGSDFDEIAQKFENKEIEEIGHESMHELKASIEKDIASTAAKRAELDSLNAMSNRLEGSIEHGIRQIRETYGEYESVKCDAPQEYIKQHKNQAESIGEEIKAAKGELSRLEREQKDFYVWDKDLTRIVTGAGLTVPDDEALKELAAKGAEEMSYDISTYEDVAREYDSHMKLLGKKQSEFEKKKNTLATLLEGYGSTQLAEEVRSALDVPQGSEETLELSDRLNETAELIALEKDRISKGIIDMERIKDNFENRCIQTCCNIKTELDRLPRLSTIRLDGETIQIVGLNIPYVSEDSYKERMSSYIDETVDIAEGFSTQEERLRYIRNRLTWKRLFSVIVTDMNAVRVNLYKRERIKDQSRFLRYEEAVGSTGQSQGIYIQFLIAIINYISSINEATGDGGVVGKTIFIDNPFGAAKDIYIWEPIFALLKTNHVQLIVPARGATPAITGRFDVNYILGQKMSEGRQTTVVVDYYSKTDTAQMEYTRMDYEQTSLFFD